ncbi:MAG: hypothetical protein ACFFE3_03635 [Candidatus Thorarchaeota archaeon]
MAEIDGPPGRQPPPERTGGGSDTSTEGLVKAVGGCCVTCCLLIFGFSFLVIGTTAWFFPTFGLTFTLIGLVCCIAGFFAARWEWGVLNS